MFITSGSEYQGEEAINIIVRPSIVNKLPTGIRLITTNAAATVKKTYVGPAKANLMPYSSGFQGGKASSRIQKVFSLGEYKSENNWEKHDYEDERVQQMQDLANSFQNDFFKTEVYESLPSPIKEKLVTMPVETQQMYLAEWTLQKQGIDIGIFNNFWLGKENKVTYEAGTFPNGVSYSKYDADLRYNTVDGVWENIMSDSTTGTPTINQIKHVDINSTTYLDAAAVAQVDTLTFTGTSGTATVTAKGVDALATFDTDLATTADNFVSASNIALYAAVGVTLSYPGSGAAVVFTSAIAGSSFDPVTIANVTGDLAGTRVATTANTTMGAIKTDGAIAGMNALLDNQSPVMSGVDDSKKKFYATKTWIRNYEKSIGVDGSNKATSETMLQTMKDGVSVLKFNGIIIEEMNIDEAIRADYNSEYPHRCILSVDNNLVLVLSSADKFGESMLWFEKKDNEVLTRTQLEQGGDYFMPELMVVIY